MTEQRALGVTGLRVSAPALGRMGMTGVYGSPDEQETIATVRRALAALRSLLGIPDPTTPQEE